MLGCVCGVDVASHSYFEYIQFLSLFVVLFVCDAELRYVASEFDRIDVRKNQLYKGG
jgi:hypothetical protein